MTALSNRVEADGVILGVDTHKEVHMAVAIDRVGRRIGELTIPTTDAGLTRLLGWA